MWGDSGFNSPTASSPSGRSPPAFISRSIRESGALPSSVPGGASAEVGGRWMAPEVFLENNGGAVGMPKCIRLTKYFRERSRFQSNFKINSLRNQLIYSRNYASAARGGGGRPDRLGRPPQKPLPFPKDIGFDTCALSPFIRRLWAALYSRRERSVKDCGRIMIGQALK